ncbi:MAG TPA: UDP-N-acetylmuramoyl-L-alanine--D-glutamate ligase [Thermodesulfovibrionales bacterium]|nr:UDP-N-acetylmuramoyl-L-alanine--D-glutamate ligase [Thermodesulfovibrionales bacterium]
MELKGKRILVVGLGRSGAGAANLLSLLGADVTVTDKKRKEQLGGVLDGISPSVKMSLGDYPESLKGIDMVVVSPGIPLTIEPLRKARGMGIKIIGELELAYEAVSGLQPKAGGDVPQFLAITGTNGKSTTTTLLDLMLVRAGFHTVFGGNIGNALTEEIVKRAGGNGRLTRNEPLEADFIVAEVSSFQLESIERFKPKGAAILNITPDHLDRYRSSDEYGEAKARIFLNQERDDFLVLNADDEETMRIYRETSDRKRPNIPEVYFFSRKREVRGVYSDGERIICNLPEGQRGALRAEFIGTEEVRIKGVHNLENAMAASAMALLAGVQPGALVEVLREFPGLEHRMEFVRELDGVQYINDSKGTNVGAVVRSIEGFREPIVLIAGGRDKAGDFGPLRSLIRERVKTLVLIGEASGTMKTALGDLTKTVLAGDFTEAVLLARQNARRGDIVLLSPACASFDMFRDFEHRGKEFKRIVMGLS